MGSIDEQQLNEFAANDAIAKFSMREMTDRKFSLVVTLTWKTGESTLYNARKSPRMWANLNTLADYIRGLGCPGVPIFLELQYEETHGT